VYVYLSGRLIRSFAYWLLARIGQSPKDKEVVELRCEPKALSQQLKVMEDSMEMKLGNILNMLGEMHGKVCAKDEISTPAGKLFFTKNIFKNILHRYGLILIVTFPRHIFHMFEVMFFSSH